MKNNKIFLYALAIGLTGLVFALGVQKNSESNIKPILEDALQESILIDFHRRQNSKRFSTSGSHLGKKIKHIKIQTENGIETFHFEDSIEQCKATQLAMQYTFIRTNPLNPKDFNTIFQKELEKMGIEGRTGIIYHHNDIAHSSESDFNSFQGIVLTEKAFIDIKNTASVQAWVNYNTLTALRHTSASVYILLAGCILASTILIRLLSSRKSKNHTEETEDKEKFTIDAENKTICIDGKMLKTTSMTFKLFQLLADNMDSFVTRRQIEEALWENPDKEGTNAIGNRINQTVSTLRNELKETSRYQINYERGKGYQLTQFTEEAENPET